MIATACAGCGISFNSDAGRRAGLAGERSGLWFEFHRVLSEIRPRWCVIENVPGLLSSNAGQDFEVILSGLVELGYGVCWRVLDAQYFGLAQRRQRVFIVGSLGDGRAAEVLFEREGVRRDPPPRREAGLDIARPLGGSAQEGGFRTTDVETGALILADPLTVGANQYSGFNGEPVLAFDTTQITSPQNRNSPKEGDPCHPLAAGAHVPAIVGQAISSKWAKGSSGPAGDEVQNMVAPHGAVRRLTPTECERLQGFPDGWTEGQADSHRYRQLGNAVAVPVAEWIGRRIVEAS